MKRVLSWGSILLLGTGIIVFSMGPKPEYPTYQPSILSMKLAIDSIDPYLAKQESKIINLKPNNASQVIWADSVRRTPYSIVYLHGFSASAMEGDPVHVNFAKRYGCNLYLPRLAGHGIKDDDSFLDLTPKDLIESAKEAVSIGKLIGEKVILMSTSTGGTLSIYLSANNPGLVDAQILFSPNIALYSSAAEILSMPWGLEIAKIVEDEYRHIEDIPTEEVHNYWTSTYRMEGLLALKYLLDETMTEEVFKQVNNPVYLGCFYKSEEVQDNVVSVPAMETFFEQIATPDRLKTFVKFPDAGHHVVVSKFHSKSVPEVEKSVYTYAEEVLGLNPVQ